MIYSQSEFDHFTLQIFNFILTIVNQRKLLNKKRFRRVSRVRAKVFGTPKRPRLAVSRSNKYVSAQLIDDSSGRTLAHASSREIKKSSISAKNISISQAAGEMLAERAKKLGLGNAVFDKRHYKYHGRIKAFAEGIKKGGVKI